MTTRARVFEGSAIGPEVTPGTAVPATRRLIGTSISPKIMTEHTTSRPRGSRMITGGVTNKEWGEAAIDEEQALYTDPVFLLSGLLGPPSISLVSSGVYLHEWDPLNWNGLVPKPFTVESGGFVQARRMPYGIVKSLGMEGSRDGVTLSGDMLGQKITENHTLTGGTAEVQTLSKTGTVSAGTFTISYMGETTAALAFGASNATVLAALEALPNIDTGDVALGGGPVNTTPVTITFAGRYAFSDVPLMTVDSALLTGGGSYGIVQSTPGAPPTETSYVPISADDWDFYLDTTAAGWGGTKLTRCFAWNWRISDMYGPVWPGNTSNPSWADIVDLAPGTEFGFRVEGNSTGLGFLTQLRSGDLVFPRIKCTGPTLGASTYMAALDFAVEITGITDDEDEDGVYAVSYNGEIAYDPTSKKYLSFDWRNNISAIA